MIFCLIVVLNNTVFCGTYPIKFLKYCISYLRISIPSNKISPSVTSYNLSNNKEVVVFPQPDSPIKAIV